MIHPYIPYFQTTRYRVAAMRELAQIQPGEYAADLGSGDGRILIELARHGANADGYELDQALIKTAEENISQAFPDAVFTKEKHSFFIPQTYTTIRLIEKDFWQENLEKCAIICMYPMPDILPELEKKLQKELKKGSRVLLNYYQLPHWQHDAEKDHIYRYIK